MCLGRRHRDKYLKICQYIKDSVDMNVVVFEENVHIRSRITNYNDWISDALPSCKCVILACSDSNIGDNLEYLVFTNLLNHLQNSNSFRTKIGVILLDDSFKNNSDDLPFELMSCTYKLFPFQSIHILDDSKLVNSSQMKELTDYVLSWNETLFIFIWPHVSLFMAWMKYISLPHVSLMSIKSQENRFYNLLFSFITKTSWPIL